MPNTKKHGCAVTQTLKMRTYKRRPTKACAFLIKTPIIKMDTIKIISAMTGIEYADMANYIALCKDMELDLAEVIEDYLSENDRPANEVEWSGMGLEVIIERALFNKLITEHYLGDTADIADLIVTDGEGASFRFVDGDGDTLPDFNALYLYVCDKAAIKVLFRYVTYPNGVEEILALFPEIQWDNNGNVASYAHIGQHSGADMDYILSISRNAEYGEYKDLKAELEGLGYKLNIDDYEG